MTSRFRIFFKKRGMKMKKLIAMAISYPNVINKESEKILKLFEAEEWGKYGRNVNFVGSGVSPLTFEKNGV